MEMPWRAQRQKGPKRKAGAHEKSPLAEVAERESRVLARAMWQRARHGMRLKLMPQR